MWYSKIEKALGRLVFDHVPNGGISSMEGELVYFFAQDWKEVAAIMERLAPLMRQPSMTVTMVTAGFYIDVFRANLKDEEKYWQKCILDALTKKEV